MSRTMKVLIVVLLVAACNSSAPSTAPPQAPSPKPIAQGGVTTRDVPANERSAVGEIKLEKVNEACEVVEVSRTIAAKHDQTVVWLVRNGCLEQRVEIVNILEALTGDQVDPFQPGPPRYCTAQANGSCAIVLVVRSTDPHPGGRSLNKVYTYDINKAGKDPELIIEWP